MLQITVLHSVSETAKTDRRNSEAQALERCLRTETSMKIPVLPVPTLPNANKSQMHPDVQALSR